MVINANISDKMINISRLCFLLKGKDGQSRLNKNFRYCLQETMNSAQTSCTSFNNDHVTYYVFIIAWTFQLHYLWIYYSITFGVIFSQMIILQL